MKKYKCHKEVTAAKIDLIQCMLGCETELVMQDDGSNKLVCNGDFVARHHPQEGGYFVEYEDGYQSYSPANTFKSGYTLVE